MREQQTRCRICGTEARPGARFCDHCGAALSPAPPVAEYKHVTVLFADVTRSMDIASAVGPERLREIMSELLDRSTRIVDRYGGTVEFIGDGVMARFGAPVAMEDHALRACLAALAIQDAARDLAAKVRMRDGLDFKIRVGLNSGQVIAGDIGSASPGYTVIGEHVGLAQRMESVAPPGGVMISETTARLIEHEARLGDVEWVHIKGADQPVPARRLLEVVERRDRRSADTTFVGRNDEIAELVNCLEYSTHRRGVVADVVGTPGIGKSRLTRELAALATDRGIEVFWTYCQSHTRDVPFAAATGLLRAFFGIAHVSAESARATTRSALPDADPQDLLLLDDMLGIGDGRPPPEDVAPDARKRRLTALLDEALLSRRQPTVYVVEDAHWIDAASEALIADFLGTIAEASALVIVTHRPEYHGVLAGAADKTVALGPLDHPSSTKLTASLVGPDTSVATVAQRITDRAAGNPFFIEEMVRDLAERRVLGGAKGAYTCHGDADIPVPASVQTTIAARIDRLAPAAKRTLNAAAALGSPFSRALLDAVSGYSVIDDLVDAELIAQVGTRPDLYAFRHPLMRAVAYESQLKTGRAELHRRIAAEIERADPDGAAANAALIATHLEAAGDLRAAFSRHMEAGTWATHRDIAAARMSWRRAVAVADALPNSDPDRLAMRIAPRTLLAATIWRVGGEVADVGFDELRQLTELAGDKRSLAIGMAGLIQMLNFHGRYTEASRLASEQVELIDAIGDPELAVALIPTVGTIAKWDAGEMSASLALAQRSIDDAAGDPTMGNLVIGSPLAMALVMRASTRCCLGISGWRQDFDDALAIARSVDKFTFSTVVMFKYVAIMNWALVADDDALRDTTEALAIARRFGDDFLLVNAEFTYGFILARRRDTDRRLGFELLAKSRQVALEHRYTIIAAWCVDLEVAAESIRRGDHDTAVDLCRGVLESEIRAGEGVNLGWSTSVLVEALLARNREGDREDAGEVVARLAAIPTEPTFLYHELPLMRMRAMLAKADGDLHAYAEMRDRYRSRAEEVGFDGHIALARAMA
ncbi:adenylate/guanylate cyclase domain-containing protein [Mycobacterium sp. NAZ190054]|uniref:ATP-binding protein n=1 Tax=Mycobacterium sp. NAZ190054 TaxID=1747766 RepID=UPI0007924C71|nr:adenylate/guanylate cyclase domain-containing protein [Mycobacterium sp. NAZ190054]KWX67560.1 cyclase [Mycobacterium sp. NAZ190054]